MLPEALGDRDADEVLDDAEGRGENEEDRDLGAADPEQRHARHHADAAEERVAEHGLGRGVELKAEEPILSGEHQQGEEHAAHHRRRNVQPVEPAHPLAELEAHEVEHRRDAQRLQEIQLQVQHVR